MNGQFLKHFYFTLFQFLYWFFTMYLQKMTVIWSGICDKVLHNEIISLKIYGPVVSINLQSVTSIKVDWYLYVTPDPNTDSMSREGAVHVNGVGLCDGHFYFMEDYMNIFVSHVPDP